MKRAFIDASSAILLYKADIFEAVANAYKLFVVPAVYKEVTVSGRAGSEFFKSFFKDGCVTPRAGGLSVDGDLLFGRSLDDGERETLHAFLTLGADFIIIDDRKGAQCCQDLNLPYVNALLCPKLLYLEGVLTAEAYRAAADILIDTGHYSKFVIDYARNCGIKVLTPFLSKNNIVSPSPF